MAVKTMVMVFVLLFHALTLTVVWPLANWITVWIFCLHLLPHAVNCITFCFWRCLWLFLFVYEISPELLNGFAPNSQGRRVWSLAGTSLKVKVNFGGLHAVYVWKNIFALVIIIIKQCLACGSHELTNLVHVFVALEQNFQLTCCRSCWITFIHNNPVFL